MEIIPIGAVVFVAIKWMYGKLINVILIILYSVFFDQYVNIRYHFQDVSNDSLKIVEIDPEDEDRRTCDCSKWTADLKVLFKIKW